jgi:hypothetical protein
MCKGCPPSKHDIQENDEEPAPAVLALGREQDWNSHGRSAKQQRRDGAAAPCQSIRPMPIGERIAANES